MFFLHPPSISGLKAGFKSAMRFLHLDGESRNPRDAPAEYQSPKELLIWTTVTTPNLMEKATASGLFFLIRQEGFPTGKIVTEGVEADFRTENVQLRGGQVVHVEVKILGGMW